MLHALIVDDEARSRDTLLRLTEKYCPEVQVVAQAGSVEEARQMLGAHPEANLVFLDVEMPGGNGFQLLDAFPEPHFLVIFVTAYDQYAIRAIRCSALDYLMKPVAIDELVESVRRAVDKLPLLQRSEEYRQLLDNVKQWKKGEPRLALPRQDGYDFIPFHYIIRLEAEGNYTWVYTKGDKPKLVSRKIGELEQLLQGHSFFRVHHSHLINTSFLQSFKKKGGGYVILSDGSQVSVSRRRRREFQDFLDGN